MYYLVVGGRGVGRAKVEQFYLGEMVPHRVQQITRSGRLLKDPIPFYSDKSASESGCII